MRAGQATCEAWHHSQKKSAAGPATTSKIWAQLNVVKITPAALCCDVLCCEPRLPLTFTSDKPRDDGRSTNRGETASARPPQNRANSWRADPEEL
jgi:hypothetical protein